MSEPEHIKFILERVFRQLEHDLRNKEGEGVEADIKADNSVITKLA